MMADSDAVLWPLACRPQAKDERNGQGVSEVENTFRAFCSTGWQFPLPGHSLTFFSIVRFVKGCLRFISSHAGTVGIKR